MVYQFVIDKLLDKTNHIGMVSVGCFKNKFEVDSKKSQPVEKYKFLDKHPKIWNSTWLRFTSSAITVITSSRVLIG